MRVYETTFILSPQADDAAFDRQIKAVSELITRYNGKVLEEDRWGIRRLAYAIKKFTQGYYTRIVFEGDNTLLKELDRFYRLEEPYIRNLTVGFEGELRGSGGESSAYHPHPMDSDSDRSDKDRPGRKFRDDAPSTRKESSKDDSDDVDSSDDNDNEEL
jgi:small subunit ribosomal protein S6